RSLLSRKADTDFMRGFFVTGTGTGVGKTVASAALAARTGYRYWKPIQTGPDDDTAEVRRLAGCEVFGQGVRLADPVSPHLAAQRAGIAIDLQNFLGQPNNRARQEGLHCRPPVPALTGAAGGEGWIVEGAGGVLVPINDSETMADLMRLLSLPIVVAARSTLGTINHTLLTLEALRSRSLQIAGVIMIGERNPDNRAAIESYGQVRILGEAPWFDPLTPECLRQWAAHSLELPE
ncbi:MAG: ATP-dependent dethiobiotin synthetase BioD, partial [Bryobacteraceae bacterium]